MAPRPLDVLALCVGAGGLELGVSLATGGRSRLVAACERDAFAASALVVRMEEATMGEAPVWDDLSTFDGRPWRGVVDLVTAGFPCQPNSAASQRLGTDDERWLWPDVARVVREVAPDFVFLENVPGLFAERGGGRDVLRDLADFGFDAECSPLSAAAVGATHERERIWILAYRHGCRFPVVGGEQLPDIGQPPRGHDADRQGGVAVGDPDREGRQGPVAEPHPRREGPRQPGRELPIFPPGPDDLDDWRTVLDRAPCLEPSLCRVADGLAHRVDRLHTTGNGVVPLVAAYALVSLARRAGIAEEVDHDA